jgi:regulator of sigma E protease
MNSVIFYFANYLVFRTPSFSIGFGPKLWSKKIGQTEFLLSAIPLGGFVEIAGTAEIGQGKQEFAQSLESDSFAIKPFYQKFLVMMGGIAFNLMFAYFVFVALVLAGIPKNDAFCTPENLKSIVKTVEPDSAAAHIFHG